MSSSKQPHYLDDKTFLGRIEGYTVKFVHANAWKLESTYERADMMQEAHCVFLKLRRHYEGTVTEPKHFMALYKTALARRFIDLARVNSDQRENEQQLSHEDMERHLENARAETDNDGVLAVMLRQAPAEVLSVVNLFLNCPQEILDMALTRWRSGAGSKTICRLLGIDESRDVMKETMTYFSER